MTDAVAGPRALFAVSPNDYVAERTSLAKATRAAGDKAGAAAVQALKRPPNGLWAVLAAADDPDAVSTVFETTAALGASQARGEGLAAATAARRAAVDALAKAAEAALQRHGIDPLPRRQEIRDLIDQLSRHPEAAASWIDGTLRDLPDQSIGFDAFANLDLAPRARPEPAPKPEPVLKPVPAPAPAPTPKPEPPPRRATKRDDDSADDLAERREAARRRAEEEAAAEAAAEAARVEAERAERAALIAEARANLARTITHRDHAAAELTAARAALEAAELRLASAEDDNDLAEAEVQAATEALGALEEA